MDELRRLLTEWKADLAARTARMRIFHTKQDAWFDYQLEYARVQMLTDHIGQLDYVLDTANGTNRLTGESDG